MSETTKEAKYEINYLGGEFRVFESGFGWAASFNRESDALRFAAGEKAIEACRKLINARRSEHLVVRLNDEEMAAVDEMKSILSALPDEETK